MSSSPAMQVHRVSRLLFVVISPYREYEYNKFTVVDGSNNVSPRRAGGSGEEVGVVKRWEW